MLTKVISGGQSGIDQAALRAARACGIATGAWCPRGFLTEDGPAPWLSEYGLTETESAAYPARTFANVKSAGLCLLLYAERQALSAGTSLTRQACRQYGVECFEAEFYLVGMDGSDGLWRPGELRSLAAADAIRRVRPGVLMVAGNRERRAPGIGVAAEAFLTAVFRGVVG